MSRLCRAGGALSAEKISFETRQVKSNRCLRLPIITVIQNTRCGFVCGCRVDTRLRAFESPDVGEYFKYPHHGCQTYRKFFTGPWTSWSHPDTQHIEISRRKKKSIILGVKMTWNFFFSQMFLRCLGHARSIFVVLWTRLQPQKAFEDTTTVFRRFYENFTLIF